jgi:CDP-glucose 4,6-dehydratase
MSFWRQRNVFVTGCTGFLGSWLTDELIAREANVVGLIRDMVPQAPFFLGGLHGKIKSVWANVEDYYVIERVLNEYEIDTVFHLAAQSIVGVANRNPMATFETNIRGTWTLLEACRRNKQVSRVVVASSDKAYGQHETLPYTEESPLKGSHPYDVSKSCADLISQTYHNTYRTPVCVTRCGNLFGPGDLNLSRIVPGTISSVLRGERPIIRSDGSPMRDYVYVRDIAAAYMTLAEHMDGKDIHGQAFNFGTDEPLSVLELTRTILRVAGREDLEPIVLNESHGEILHQYLSSERAKNVLKWRLEIPMAQRLAETVQWYRDYFSSCQEISK